MFMFESKKAMSPLIATVFLIAFAVALGVMIMNWTPAESTISEIYSKNCEGIKIEVTKMPCMDHNNNLVFGVRNVGFQKINSLMIKSKTNDEDSIRNIKGSSLIATEQIEKIIPFSYTEGNIEMRIIPLVLEKEQFIECTKSSIYITSLPKC
jgi:flagellin-like protein